MNTNKINSPLLKIFIREMHRIAERKTIYLLSIILPVFLFFLLALIYKNGVVRDLPVAIYDADNSEISRMLARSIDASSSMRITEYYNSVDEVKAAFRKGIIQGAFYFPQGMGEDLKKGNNSTAVIFKNTSSLIIGNMIYKDGMTIVRTFSAGVLLKKFRSKGIPEEKAMNMVNPIRIETQSLYNPNYNYLSYLIPGLLTAILQMIVMIAGVLVISSEFTHKTFPELVRLADNNMFTILIGKSLPHLAIHFATALGLIGIIFPIFAIEINGSSLFTFFFLAYFIMASFFVAFLLSSIFHEQLFATEIALFVNTPAFIFSGYTFPLWGMPALHNYFAQLIPFTHFLTGFLKIYQMGTPLVYIMPEFVKLSIFLFGSAAASLLVLRYQTNHYTENQTAAAEV